MPDQLPIGPYSIERGAGNREIPFYIIPFDKEGRCTGPESRRHLVDAVRSGRHSHVFLFSHGWNNDWATAKKRYDEFLKGFLALREQHQLPEPEDYAPLLVGIFWPSTALVFGEDEEGPDIAATDPAARDRDVAAERTMVEDLASEIASERVERFYALAQRPELDAAEAAELAAMLAPLVSSDAAEADAAAPTAEEVLSSWRAVARDEGAGPGFGDEEDFGTVTEAGAAPQAAGLLDKLDPRPLLRAFTVWTMKDRAGVVGARGVGPLLRDLLAADPDIHLHLVGHSYGAKVVLSALCAAPLPRQADSALLLQPAVSHLCFALEVPGSQAPGGYHQAPARLRQPILSTFSRKDKPLTKVFHLALRRGRDLGEAVIAAPDEPPSRYAALGGFGPRGCGERLIDILDPVQPYTLGAGPGVVGLRGHRTIGGHGEISNPSTWWCLHTQVAATT